MTLVLKLDLDMVKVYHHAKNEVSMQGQIQDFLLGGAPTLIGGGANLQHRCFSVKTYVKMKEFGPVGGVHAGNFCM